VVKDTAGKTILQHDALRLDIEDDVIEYRKAMEPGIMQHIHNTAHAAKTKPQYTNKDFYIVLITTVDRVLRSPKIIPLARLSCPTPVYKQSVWKFKHTSGELEFLWSIPDALLYHHILRNQTQFLLDKECAELAKFVILMESGSLLRWVKTENGEKIDAVIKIEEQVPCLKN
jgi:hypothetical protein